RSAVLRGGGGEELARLEYGAAATVWRLNLGERRRGDRQRLGYQLDVERGYWDCQETATGAEDRLSPRLERVIPYVEDQRNCLLLRPAAADLGTMASLTAALKAAIQVTFQLEDRELAAEALPDAWDRRLILFYEAAEGGAGVLRLLIDDPATVVEVARKALEICHFDPGTGGDRRRAPGRDEDCEAACYDCLLSYYNQRDHRHLDRHTLPELLLAWAQGSLVASPTEQPRASHLERLLRLADSELERRWLRLLERLGLRLPDDAQVLIDTCRVRPDFFYRDHDLAVFVDGPPHDAPDQKARDDEQQDALEAEGYHVLRFHHRADWEELLRAHLGVFGPADENGG
ncbi:MAG: DUF1998 domain-containing protein, partial [bacterium]|nr:DUF1998 domain-containing protein [bacterium]